MAKIHNESGITPPVSTEIGWYFTRKIRTIHPDAISGALCERLRGTELEGVPLIGSLSEVANFTAISNDAAYRKAICGLYET